MEVLGLEARSPEAGLFFLGFTNAFIYLCIQPHLAADSHEELPGFTYGSLL